MSKSPLSLNRGCRNNFDRLLLLTFLCVVTCATAPLAQERNDIFGPAGSVSFGESVVVLPNGNFVVVDSSAGALSTGAVSLYNGETRQLISRLFGTNQQDRVGGNGGGVNVVPSGDFIVRSPNWNMRRGAVTYCSKTTGCNGAVSPENSLVGFAIDNYFGNSSPVILPNGNFLIPMIGSIFPGAVAFFDGSAPTVGQVSVQNSLIGERPADRVGQGGVSVLANGRYLIESPDWNEGRGAVTFCDSTVGCKGFISAANSVVGQNPGNRVGNSPVYMESSVKEIGNGNYIVMSSTWDNGSVQDVGAVTWLNSAGGLNGAVSIENSLVGAITNAKLGSVTVLENGNYVVLWSVGNTGGATFGNAQTGVFGLATEANSLVGTGTNNDFYLASVVALTNGNYVVNAPSYKFADGLRGGARWCSGTTGCTGQMTVTSSLVGTGNYGYPHPVTPLANGNYVVRGSKSATFGNGTSGVTGTITSENSLVSPNHGGLGMEIVALPNGNYYVLNAWWDPPAAPGSGSRGAVTFGNGQTGVVGVVSEANSMVNERSGDTSEFSFRLLPSGDLLLLNYRWNNYRGAVTRLSGTFPQTGVISGLNSIVGTYANDGFGGDVTTILSNGNYVVATPNWNSARGAVRLCYRNQPCVGESSEANSLVGTSPNDRVGYGVIEVNNTHFVVRSTLWNGDKGAVTLVNSKSGLKGTVGIGNSLVGSTTGDLIGNGDSLGERPIAGVTGLGNGLFQVYSPGFATSANADAGAMTFSSVNDALVGTVNDGKTILGTTAETTRSYSFAYDPLNRQVIVGRRLSNAVSIYKFTFSTPSHASISGTLKAPNGFILRKELVKLTGDEGTVIWRTTNMLGNFEFRNVPTTHSFTLTVESKRFRFTPQHIPSVMADVYVGYLTGRRVSDNN